METTGLTFWLIKQETALLDNLQRQGTRQAESGCDRVHRVWTCGTSACAPRPHALPPRTSCVQKAATGVFMRHGWVGDGVLADSGIFAHQQESCGAVLEIFVDVNHTALVLSELLVAFLDHGMILHAFPRHGSFLQLSKVGSRGHVNSSGSGGCRPFSKCVARHDDFQQCLFGISVLSTQRL